MVRSGLKKLAVGYGLKVAQGLAFGDVLGYATTLSEESGYKTVAISTKLVEEQKAVLRNRLAKRDLGREFCIEELRLSDEGITTMFLSRPGTLAKMQAFIQWFYPFLDEVQADGSNICSVCGREVAAAGVWKLNDGVARWVHPSCALREVQTVAPSELPKVTETGSYARGLLGALVGAVLGAVVWAVILGIGYVTCVVGLLIGWLAVKGYQKLKGRAGSKKPLILGIAVLVGILLGTAAGEALAVGKMVAQGAVPGAAMPDIPLLIYYILSADPAYLRGMLGNMGLGLVFGLLLVFFLLRREAQEAPIPEN